MMCPIDVVKTRIQLQKIKGVTMFEVGRNLVEKEGASVLLTGFGATSAGYLLQVS